MNNVNVIEEFEYFFNELKVKLDKIINPDDAILFYFVYENKKIKKDYLGRAPKSSNIII